MPTLEWIGKDKVSTIIKKSPIGSLITNIPTI